MRYLEGALNVPCKHALTVGGRGNCFFCLLSNRTSKVLMKKVERPATVPLSMYMHSISDVAMVGPGRAQALPTTASYATPLY